MNNAFGESVLFNNPRGGDRMKFVTCLNCKGRIKKGCVVYKADHIGIICSECRKKHHHLTEEDVRKVVLPPDEYLDSKRIDEIKNNALELSLDELYSLFVELRHEWYIRRKSEVKQ